MINKPCREKLIFDFDFIATCLNKFSTTGFYIGYENGGLFEKQTQ